jgi:hypothetical protein
MVASVAPTSSGWWRPAPARTSSNSDLRSIASVLFEPESVSAILVPAFARATTWRRVAGLHLHRRADKRGRIEPPPLRIDQRRRLADIGRWDLDAIGQPVISQPKGSAPLTARLPVTGVTASTNSRRTALSDKPSAAFEAALVGSR